MRNFVVGTLVAVVAALGLACTTVSPVVNTASIGDIDFSQPMREGESCQWIVLGFIGPFGTASVVDSARNGDISRVKIVDYSSAWYVVVTKRCVITYGE
jgi:hypothetical protein